MTSQFFHFGVSRGGAEPTDQNFKKTLENDFYVDFCFNYLWTAGPFDRTRDDLVEVANHIVKEHDFLS